MSRILRRMDRIPFLAWPVIGTAGGTIAAGVVVAGQILIGVLSS